MAKKYLLEDEESDFTLKAKRRAVDCKRVAELARSAAEKAKQDNRLDLAAKLEQEAESLEKIAKNWNTDEVEDDSEQKDADIVLDIFHMKNNKRTSATSRKPRKPTIDEVVDIISSLPADDKNSAIQGLQDILDDSVSLSEAFEGKSLRELSDDEFADGINAVLDLIDKIQEPDYIDQDDKEARKDKIRKLANDPIANRELQIEDNIELQKDFQKTKARQKEMNKYSNHKTIEQFKINFYRSIKDQVERVEDDEETYTRINAPMDDAGVIRPGERLNDLPGDIPSVDLYFDRSGSWTSDEQAIKIGKEAVATIKQFADRGEIKLNVYYFSSIITTNEKDSRLGGGTYAWNAIIQNIKQNKTKNVVLMTDADMDTQARDSNVCVVPGEVWLIWKDKYGCKDIADKLRGKRGNHQYAF